MPLLRAEWWEAHQPLVVFMWIILLVVPFAIVYGAGDTFETVLECIVNDYLTFIVLLFVFYHLDKKAYRKDIAEGRKPDISRPGTEFYIEGLHNIILLAAFLSIKTTDSSIRTKNHFTWGAIKEVAVLFIGIFITMQPALMLLKSVGPNLGISEPYQMFWATGALSSFLDNTPTYLVWQLVCVGIALIIPSIIGAIASFCYFIRCENDKIWSRLISVAAIWGIIRIVINNYQMIRYAEQYLSMNTTVRLVLQMAIYGLILYQTFTLTKKRKNAIEISNTENTEKQKNLID